jgi:glycosyltransferase involved in cell wall biosynthesis
MTAQKTNILHLRDSPWVCGPGRTILESGVRINPERYGYFVGAFCRKGSSEFPLVQGALDRNLNVFPIYESHSYDPTILLQIRRIVQMEKIDIIHTHEVRSDAVGLTCAKLCRIPVVTTLHGWIANNIKGRVLTRLDKSVLRFFDHVIAVSDKIREAALLSGVKEDRVSVLHNALIIEDYCPNRKNREFRKEISVSDKCLLIGNIGRLSPEKGQADFIKAASLVLKERKDVKFVLIGKGDDEVGLKELTQELEITHEVIFAGYRDDMQNIYNSLDLVVQSSYTEGMPNVILESLAMEVPVIASDVGGTAEVVDNNETGLLMPPGKPEEIAEKILLFIHDRNMFGEMAKKGRRHVEANFNFDARTKKLSFIYDRVCPR